LPAIREVQQALLRDGCFLPNVKNEDPADQARAARASASSQALLREVTPDSRGCHAGLGVWLDQPQYTDEDRLSTRRGQWIGVGTDHIDSLAVCLSNSSGQPQQVQAWLLSVGHIWDYRCQPGPALASATLEVPSGERQWIEWPVSVPVTPGRYVRLDLGANPAVTWHTAGTLEPGHLAAYAISGERMRRYGHGLTMSFRVSPPQPCYGPANVLSGVTRPYQSTNLWRSDPALPLPQWLELAWAEPRTLRQIELVFPGHLIREYHAYGPFYRDAQCPRDYSLEAWVDGAWAPLASVQGNYQRHRRHTLVRPVVTEKLRVVVTATNGDPSAAIYEVRCY
jgi:hypothetical protein